MAGRWAACQSSAGTDTAIVSRADVLLQQGHLPPSFLEFSPEIDRFIMRAGDLIPHLAHGGIEGPQLILQLAKRVTDRGRLRAIEHSRSLREGPEWS